MSIYCRGWRKTANWKILPSRIQTPNFQSKSRSHLGSLYVKQLSGVKKISLNFTSYNFYLRSSELVSAFLIVWHKLVNIRHLNENTPNLRETNIEFGGHILCVERVWVYLCACVHEWMCVHECGCVFECQRVIVTLWMRFWVRAAFVRMSHIVYASVCTRLVGRGGDVVQAVPGSVLPQTEEKMLSCYF